jgi:hypothetical protein
MLPSELPGIKRFKGLSNVSDPLRVGLGWLTKSNNLDVTDTGALKKREGYHLALAGAPTEAFATADESRMYVVDGSGLYAMAGPTASVFLQGLAAPESPMYWAEVNGLVYFNNGTDSGVIAQDNTVAVWRGAPMSDGAGFIGDDGAVLEVLYSTLPMGADVIQFYKGRMYAAQYFPSEDQTVVWFSEPLGFHLFNLDSNFFMVPGRVTMLAPHDAALIVGTDKGIHAYSIEGLALLAPYGVIPGQHWADDDKRILFWTTRGVCAALPFSNLTERQVSVAPGVRAGGTVVRSGGQKRYLVALQQGNTAFNHLL